MPARSTHKVPRLLSAFFTRVARAGGGCREDGPFEPRLSAPTRAPLCWSCSQSVCVAHGRGRSSPCRQPQREHCCCDDDGPSLVLSCERLLFRATRAIARPVCGREKERAGPPRHVEQDERRKGLGPARAFYCWLHKPLPLVPRRSTSERAPPGHILNAAARPSQAPFFVFFSLARGGQEANTAPDNAEGDGAVYLSFISA